MNDAPIRLDLDKMTAEAGVHANVEETTPGLKYPSDFFEHRCDVVGVRVQVRTDSCGERFIRKR